MSAWDDYLAAVAKLRVEHPEQRAGQAHWNVLVQRYPSLADRVLHGTDADPFYVDDRLPAFLAAVRPELEWWQTRPLPPRTREFVAPPDDVPVPPRTDPALDPAGTLRVEDWSRRLDPDVRRVIKLDPRLDILTRPWVQFSGPSSLGNSWDHAEVTDWHVAPYLTVAVAFRHAEHERVRLRPAPALLDGSDAEGAAPFRDARDRPEG